VDVSWAKSNSISSDNTVILYKPDDSVSDKVGFGNAADYEVEVFPNNPGDNESLHRNSDIDTNNNKEDFLIDDSTPQNSNTFGEFLTPNGLTEGVDAVSVNHLVISEVYINMDGSDDEEFIELYNPTNGIINLENYSLQYLSGSASSTEQITKKNFNNGNISSKGFYLIGLNGYSGEVDADMTWSQSLNNTSATIALVATTSVISDESDSNIVDKVAYGVSNGYLFPETTAALLPSEGSSLERKAFKNSSCSDSVDSGEFLGNGCDTDNNSDNFIERENPNPQNSNSLIEPRNSPIDINNFSAEYNTSTLSINLNWDESYNYAGNSENITYVLTYATSTENDLSEVTATTTYNFNIDEAGIDYEFGIIAKDINGLASEKSSATLSVPTLINNLYLYKDTRSTSSKEYLLEFDYNSYPFIPDTFDKGDAWKIAIFYLNIEAPNEIELNTFNNWSPENIDNVLA
ncbi:lamin tail domain-containing protein, partial [Candidatus Wolfebacteria bacterium]|nr:lamin tail domain-containing protein [Candidatus Wolfebacteria bacterium]